MSPEGGKAPVDKSSLTEWMKDEVSHKFWDNSDIQVTNLRLCSQLIVMIGP
jgi:hypothetical protein